MKKNCYILFTLMAFAALFAAYPLVKWQQWRIQEAQRERILHNAVPDSLTEQFTDIDKDATVQWQEEGRECYVNGKLYDVVSTGTRHGHTVFHCISDEQEEKAISAWNSMNGQDPAQQIPGKRLALKLIRELFSLFFTPAAPFSLFCFSQEKTNSYSFSYYALREYLPEVNIPPPEIAC